MCLASESNRRDDEAAHLVAGRASLGCQVFGLDEHVRAATVRYMVPHRVPMTGGGPQGTLDGVQEFRLINGLLQDAREVSGVETLGVSAGDDDDRNVARLCPAGDLALDVQAAYARQPEIEHDGVRGIAAEDACERLETVFDGADEEPGTAKCGSIQFAKRRIILDHENAGDADGPQWR